MIGDDLAGHCRDLTAQLATTGLEDEERLARLLAEHIATCPDCVAAENALETLVASYRAAGEPPLSPDSERRLLDRLCGAG